MALSHVYGFLKDTIGSDGEVQEWGTWASWEISLQSVLENRKHEHL